jgi:hypothetical protein
MVTAARGVRVNRMAVTQLMGARSAARLVVATAAAGTSCGIGLP